MKVDVSCKEDVEIGDARLGSYTSTSIEQTNLDPADTMIPARPHRSEAGGFRLSFHGLERR